MKMQQDQHISVVYTHSITLNSSLVIILSTKMRQVETGWLACCSAAELGYERIFLAITAERWLILISILHFTFLLLLKSIHNLFMVKRVSSSVKISSRAKSTLRVGPIMD